MRTHTPSSCPPVERNEPNGPAKPPRSTERCNASPSSPLRTTERTRSNTTGMIRATARISRTARKHKLSLTPIKCANGQSKSSNRWSSPNTNERTWENASSASLCQTTSTSQPSAPCRSSPCAAVSHTTHHSPSRAAITATRIPSVSCPTASSRTIPSAWQSTRHAAVTNGSTRTMQDASVSMPLSTRE